MEPAASEHSATDRVPISPNPRPTHVLAVSSGKGGVGKSNFVLNVGLALAMSRRRVLAMDADMGLGNIDILLGTTSPHNLSHVIRGEKTLEDIVNHGPSGLDFLPAASGVEWMTQLTTEQKIAFLEKMESLNGRYDLLLIDTGAGISSNVLYFNLAAQTRIVLVTPEPTSLTDAYAFVKVLSRKHSQKDFQIVVNGVKTEQEGLDIYKKLTLVTDRFLDVNLGYLGCIPRDYRLERAVMRQTPVIELYPDAPISTAYRILARRIAQLPPRAHGNELGLFWRKMIEPAAV
ncbi:MinD/ParA family protein [Candidatus Sumerlaeota bacterium]|nr:MinD/ParA family protein [Candidatus Sumerlaeota bacterium]